MKKKILEKRLLEELERLPIPSVACHNLGISRQTFYRWKKLDLKLKNKIEKAMEVGRLSICDLSEGKLIELIKEKEFHAIRYWLDHKHPDYAKNGKLEQALKKLDDLDAKQHEVRSIISSREMLLLMKDLGILTFSGAHVEERDLSEKMELLHKLFEKMYGETEES